MPQNKAIIGLIFFSVLFFSAIASAQEETDWKQEIISDREQLQGQKQTIKENASVAKEEEQRLRQDIQKALQAGDVGTADKLLEQLKAAHRENMQQKKEDMGSLKEMRQELRPPKPPLPEEQQAAETLGELRGRREDIWDAKHNPPPGTPGYRRDKLEDIRDRREDILDRKEDVRDHREDVRDRREDIRERKEDKGGRPGEQHAPVKKQEELKNNQGLGQDKGVRDRGAGVGAGKGQGGARRSPKGGPKPR